MTNSPSTGFEIVTERGKTFPRQVSAEPAAALLVFDFDGTLAHMDPDPEAVSLVPRSGAAIADLADAGAKIAVISGRPVASLRRLGDLDEEPGFKNAVLLGQYGIEKYEMRTGEERHPPIPPQVESARGDLEALTAAHPGAHLEDKGRALAVHVRRMENPEAAFEVLETPVREIAAEHGLVVEPGRFVWELRSTSIDKGDGLTELVETLRPAAVMMVGDDLGDLPAFEVLADLGQGGLPICAVVSGSAEQPRLAEVADVLCAGPDGVAEWLEFLAKELSRADTDGT